MEIIFDKDNNVRQSKFKIAAQLYDIYKEYSSIHIYMIYKI